MKNKKLQKIKSLKKTHRITNKEPVGIQFVFLPGQITQEEIQIVTKKMTAD